MKKTIFLTLLLLSFSGYAFAAHTALAQHAVTPAGVGIYGGADSTTVGVNPLGKLSTGVTALVNWEAASAKLSTTYSLCTKHTNGSKIFGTANDATNIFWKASPSKIVMNATTDETGSTAGVANFSTAGSWTSY